MCFDNVKKNFGFGCMRLPMRDKEVDRDEFCKMADAFIDAGFNYFDTAHMYLDGKSETAVRDCVSARYPREAFVLADKLSEPCFEKEEDIRPLFFSQLELCGVEYFDFYLHHCLTRGNYDKYKRCNAFETVKELKEEGLVRHIAMSFHDTADILDIILSEQPSIEAVQLQFNYLDYDDPGVQSKACYDVAIKHGKKVIVMEPVKGGTLVKLPESAAAELDALGGGSYASYALRFAASFPEVFMVLSGMGSMEMTEDNIKTMRDFVPLSSREFEATDKVRNIIRQVRQIPCTGCRYCEETCPENIPVAATFAVYNEYLSAKADRSKTRERLASADGISRCVRCGKCEQRCPQNIEIRKQLQTVEDFMK